MIVSAMIDESGAVQVSLDSDGDQGEGYSTEVMDDLVTRAGRHALSLWLAARGTQDVDAE